MLKNLQKQRKGIVWPEIIDNFWQISATNILALYEIKQINLILVNSSQYHNVMDLIFASNLYDVDYFPFNQPSAKFEQSYKLRWNSK